METSDIVTIIGAILGSGSATYVTLKVKQAVNETKIKFIQDEIKKKASKSDLDHLHEDVKELKGTKSNVYENIGDLTKSITEMTTIMKANGVASEKAHKGLRAEFKEVKDDVKEMKSDMQTVKMDVEVLKLNGSKKK